MDKEDSPIHAIVSVLMLREGWDVQNVAVVVGLRPDSAKANIPPEQGCVLLTERLLTPGRGAHGFIHIAGGLFAGITLALVAMLEVVKIVLENSCPTLAQAFSGGFL